MTRLPLSTLLSHLPLYYFPLPNIIAYRPYSFILFFDSVKCTVHII
jgi:hypothetical protein